ncbi:MAG: GNAT family N-acetyltransferase [Candidatus Omnitrophota bacterium]
MVKIHKITTDDGFIGLKDQWNELLSQSNNDNIFLTWEWLYSWWEVFKEKRELFILLVKENEEIIGIAPLLLRKICYFRLLNYNRLEFIASGEEERDEICSEYLNFIIKKGKEKEVIGCLVDYFKVNKTWDEIVLKELLAENINTVILRQQLTNSGVSNKCEKDGVAYYIELPKTWDELVTGLSSNFRYKLKRDRKRLSSMAQVEVRTIEKKEDLSMAFSIFIDLHEKRWSAEGEQGCFRSEKFKQFHGKVMRNLFDKKQVRLIFLDVNKKPVAAFYDLIYKGKVLFYQAGLDLECYPKLGVGNILRGYSIQKAVEGNAAEYDFLKGENKRHCKEWATVTRDIITIRILKNKLRYALFCIFRKIKEKIKR